MFALYAGKNSYQKSFIDSFETKDDAIKVAENGYDAGWSEKHFYYNWWYVRDKDGIIVAAEGFFSGEPYV